MPNGLAYLMLWIWPLVTVVMFRRLTVERAFIWTILGGYLILPPVAYLDVPLAPPLDKHSIPALSAFFALWLRDGKTPRLVPQAPIARLFVAIFLLSGIGTVLTNDDPIIVGVAYLPPLPTVEVVFGIVYQFMGVLPLLLAQDLLKRPDHLREIVVALVVAGLLYSFPMLVEIRLSPQLNVWIYGFFQHNFDQMVRYGGFRPIVFLQHGLWVAMFAFTAAGCALTMLKVEPAQQRKYFALMIYLAVVLVLCKTAGALIYMVAFAPLVLFTTARMQTRIAAVLALIVVLYPLLRGSGLIPTDAIFNQASAMDEARSRSLEFRLMNEEMLLERASERPLFGWGGWARNHLHDPATGEFLTVVDGLWIGTLGTQGWAGYLGLFGLLTAPLLLLVQKVKSAGTAAAPYAAPLALLLSANLVDLIPNATLTPVTWLMAGALLGYASVRVERKRAPATRPAPWARKASPTLQFEPNLLRSPWRHG